MMAFRTLPKINFPFMRSAIEAGDPLSTNYIRGSITTMGLGPGFQKIADLLGRLRRNCR